MQNNAVVMCCRMNTLMNMQFHLMQTSSAKHMLWFMMATQVHFLITSVSVTMRLLCL